MTALAVLLATVGGAGRVPVAPGTVGSAIGVGLYLFLADWSLPLQLGVVMGITVVGVWASDVAARHFGREDPGVVVIDEVAGQLVTLLLTGVSMPGVVAGFLLFRLFDIIKPWPANRFERLPGGLGIMADDVMAGIYGNLVLQVGILVAPGWL